MTLFDKDDKMDMFSVKKRGEKVKTGLCFLAVLGILVVPVSTNEIVYAEVENKLEQYVEVEEEPKIVYDGLTKEELINKINKSLNSTISGKGNIIVEHSLKLGLDPYLATAIILHETGCKWNCSTLVKKCNNVGGQKGKPSCNGGSYKRYDTLDEGLIGYMDNLYYNYIAKGLKTPEQIGPKYAMSKSWAGKVNKYIQEIKS